MDSLQLEERLGQEEALEIPELLLKRMLSIKSVISTVSSLAKRQQAAVGTKSMSREIGTGFIIRQSFWVPQNRVCLQGSRRRPSRQALEQLRETYEGLPEFQNSPLHF